MQSVVVAGLVTLATPALARSPPAAEAENSGQDPTRPVTRVDVRMK